MFKTEEKTCPVCGAPLKVCSGKRSTFWGCTNYPYCKHFEHIKWNKEFKKKPNKVLNDIIKSIFEEV